MKNGMISYFHTLTLRTNITRVNTHINNETCFVYFLFPRLCFKIFMPPPIDFIPIWLIQILTSKLPLLKKSAIFHLP